MDVVCAHSPEADREPKNLGLEANYSHDVMLVVTGFLWKVWRNSINDYATLYNK
jgi:hypothetical protein